MSATEGGAETPDTPRCDCPPCPGRGNDGHGMTHCAECCWGSGVEADEDCPVHGHPTPPAHTDDREGLTNAEIVALGNAVLTDGDGKAVGFDHTVVERILDARRDREGVATVEWGLRDATGLVGGPWLESVARARGSHYTLVRRERVSTPDRVTPWEEVGGDE